MSELRLEQDRLAVQRNTNAHLRAALLDLLEAPYLGGPAPALAKTNACYELGHPKRETGACYCGRRGKR